MAWLRNLGIGILVVLLWLTLVGGIMIWTQRSLTQADIFSGSIYWAAGVTPEIYSRKLSLTVKNQNDTLTYDNISANGYDVFRHLAGMDFWVTDLRILLISPDGFEIGYVEEHRAPNHRATLRTAVLFFPFDKITVKRLWRKYQLTGKFIPCDNNYGPKVK